MNTTEIKYELLKTELSLTQAQMDKYDQLSSTTKTWTLTLWAATVSWTLQAHVPEIALLSVVSTFLFWFFDAYNKRFRQNYKARRNEIATLLESYSKTGQFPDEAKVLHLPTHKNGGLLKSFFLPHICLPYVILIALAFAVGIYKFQ